MPNSSVRRGPRTDIFQLTFVLGGALSELLVKMSLTEFAPAGVP